MCCTSEVSILFLWDSIHAQEQEQVTFVLDKSHFREIWLHWIFWSCQKQLKTKTTGNIARGYFDNSYRFIFFLNSWPGKSDCNAINQESTQQSQCSFTSIQSLLSKEDSWLLHFYTAFPRTNSLWMVPVKNMVTIKRVKHGDIFSASRCKQTNKNTKEGKQSWHRWALLHVAFHT